MTLGARGRQVCRATPTWTCSKIIGAIEVVVAILIALFGANIIRVDDQGFAVGAGALAIHMGGMTALGAGGLLSGKLLWVFVFHIPLIAYAATIAVVI